MADSARNSFRWKNAISAVPFECRYDLTNGASDPGLLGRAYRPGVCTSLRESINEDVGIYRTAQVGAHELGHKWGSYWFARQNNLLFALHYNTHLHWQKQRRNTSLMHVVFFYFFHFYSVWLGPSANIWIHTLHWGAWSFLNIFCRQFGIMEIDLVTIIIEWSK